MFVTVKLFLLGLRENKIYRNNPLSILEWQDEIIGVIGKTPQLCQNDIKSTNKIVDIEVERGLYFWNVDKRFNWYLIDIKN